MTDSVDARNADPLDVVVEIIGGLNHEVAKLRWGEEGTTTNVAATSAGALPIQAVSASGALQETTITVGEEAQYLFSSATPTNGFEILNPSDTEILYFREGAVAEIAGDSSWPIPAGGGYTTPMGYRPTGPISVIATTVGHAVIARRW